MRPNCFEDPDLPDPLALRRYTAVSDIHDRLRELGGRRALHRHHRWVITKSWFVAAVSALLVVTAWWMLVPAIAFALLAMHRMATTDWRAGHELDADIAAATRRLREVLNGSAG